MGKLKMTGAFLLLIAVFGCSKKDEPDKYSDVLAVVGSDTIRAADLINLLEKQNRTKVDFRNDKMRQDFLNNLVQNKLIYFYGLENKLNELNEVKLDVTTRRDEIYYEKVLKSHVYYPMISEGDIAAFYEKLKVEIRVRQILIGFLRAGKIFMNDATEVRRSKVEAKLLADSLYAVLKAAPQKFDTLVEKYSDDYASKFLKGDAGFLRWGTKPVLEKAVFALNVGDISEPIETDNGFYLIKPVEKRNVGNLRSFDEARTGVREMMIPYLVRDRKAEFDAYKTNFSDSLLKTYRFDVNAKNCDIFLEAYRMIKNPAEIVSAFSPDEMDLALITFQNGKISVAELVHVMEHNTKLVKMDRKILNEGLKNAALRRICSDIARKQNYELDKNELESLKQYESNLMVGIAVQRQYAALEIMERDIKAYYETNKNEYRETGKVNISEIVSQDLKPIMEIFEEVKSRNNFDSIYSRALRTEGFTCRVTGLIPDDNSDYLRQMARKVSTGGFSEPYMKVTKESAILKVIDRKPGAVRPYSAVREFVRQDYENFKKQIAYNEWIANLSAQYKVQIFPDRLKNVFDIKLK